MRKRTISRNEGDVCLFPYRHRPSSRFLETRIPSDRLWDDTKLLGKGLVIFQSLVEVARVLVRNGGGCFCTATGCGIFCFVAKLSSFYR